MARQAAVKRAIVALTLLALAALLFGHDRVRDFVHGHGARGAGPAAPREAGGHDADVRDVRDVRGNREAGDGEAPAGSVDPALLPSRGVMDEATVTALLPHLAHATWVRYDPLALVRVVPDLQLTMPWPEHAGGAVTLASNNLGFREDVPTAPRAPRAPGTRVAVLGDSHTFGLVENRESFANLLEARLSAERPDAPCEVLNGGVTGTGPYESRALLGVLLAELEPQAVVFVLYAGNDFLNALAFADAEARRPRQPMPLAAQQRLVAARAVERDRLAQATNQAHSFRYRAGDADRALLAALQDVLEMAQYCAERHARFLVAVLPCKEDCDRGDMEHMRAVLDTLQLCDEDLAVNGRLAARCVEALSAAGVDVVDLLPALRDQDRPMFWKRDHHLGVDGHRAVSRALLAPLRELLDRR